MGKSSVEFQNHGKDRSSPSLGDSSLQGHRLVGYAEQEAGALNGL